VQGFLQATFRKFYDLVCQYNVPLCRNPHERGEKFISGARVFNFIFLTTNFQKYCLSFLEVHIIKILKSAMTLAATVAGRRNTPGHLFCESKKSVKMGKTIPHFSEKRYFPVKWQVPILSTNPDVSNKTKSLWVS
jgi:hypothetical protein